MATTPANPFDVSATDAATASASWADLAGVAASVGCAIHCAAMPLVIGYLPTLGLGWLAGDGFHQAMAVLCLALAASAFVPGWRTHRRLGPVVAGMAGVVLLTSAAFGAAGDCCASSPSVEQAELTCQFADCQVCAKAEASTPAAESESPPEPPGALATVAPWLTPLGGLILVGAHVANHRLAGKCGPGDEPCCGSTEGAACSVDSAPNSHRRTA